MIAFLSDWRLLREAGKFLYEHGETVHFVVRDVDPMRSEDVHISDIFAFSDFIDSDGYERTWMRLEEILNGWADRNSRVAAIIEKFTGTLLRDSLLFLLSAMLSRDLRAIALISSKGSAPRPDLSEWLRKRSLFPCIMHASASIMVLVLREPRLPFMMGGLIKP